MTRMLAMHQPNFLPWVGYFHKMAHADAFVVLDEVQVPQGRSWASRTKIKTPTGVQWLSLPLKRDGRNSYREQKVRPRSEWADRLWKKIECNYRSAPYWNYCDFAGWWDEAIQRDSLADINTCLLVWATHALAIRTRLYFQRVERDKQENPIALCALYNCSTYLSGQGARKYNDPELFRERGVELVYQEFECPEYSQLWGEFEPNLSVLDLIFNCGPDGREILCQR